MVEKQFKTKHTVEIAFSNHNGQNVLVLLTDVSNLILPVVATTSWGGGQTEGQDHFGGGPKIYNS